MLQISLLYASKVAGVILLLTANEPAMNRQMHVGEGKHHMD
jgi:hypothetical protein